VLYVLRDYCPILLFVAFAYHLFPIIQACILRDPGRMRIPVRRGRHQPDDHVLHAAGRFGKDPHQEWDSGGGQKQHGVTAGGGAGVFIYRGVHFMAWVESRVGFVQTVTF
jgi:hypothetical protein